MYGKQERMENLRRKKRMKSRFLLILGMVVCFLLSSLPGFGQRAKQPPAAPKASLTEMQAAEAATKAPAGKAKKTKSTKSAKKGKKTKAAKKPSSSPMKKKS